MFDILKGKVNTLRNFFMVFITGSCLAIFVRLRQSFQWFLIGDPWLLAVQIRTASCEGVIDYSNTFFWAENVRKTLQSSVRSIVPYHWLFISQRKSRLKQVSRHRKR